MKVIFKNIMVWNVNTLKQGLIKVLCCSWPIKKYLDTHLERVSCHSVQVWWVFTTSLFNEITSKTPTNKHCLQEKTLFYAFAAPKKNWKLKSWWWFVLWRRGIFICHSTFNDIPGQPDVNARLTARFITVFAKATLDPVIKQCRCKQ
jgi:hypothetical protein